MGAVDSGRLRRTGELALPGFAVGALAGVVAGGLTAIAGQPLGWAMTSAVGLALPLGLAGGLYSLLMVHGVVRPGTFAPAALLWLVGFPLGRLVQEVAARYVILGEPGVPEDLLGFLAFQAIISAGFAIGFLWMHERIAPQWLAKIAVRNPDAAVAYDRYAAHSRLLSSARQARREAKAKARANRR
ncbi:hypothetical protein [Amycolatopsis magusensis]|uniref:hypothetical protein n=1 Tax=Amycolatopsis magusensis TaxID=882444 RepID=UPI003C300750